MRHQIFSFALICFFASCISKKLSIEIDNPKLTINTTKDTISDFVNITVFLENNTTNDIYLLNKEVVTISRNRASPLWNLEILFQDTIPMIIPIFDPNFTPSKKDYVLLKSGDKHIFNFDIDFKTLIREDLHNFRELNNDYGEYSLRLTYKDSFLIDKRAFQGIIESNVISLLYREF